MTQCVCISQVLLTTSLWIIRYNENLIFLINQYFSGKKLTCYLFKFKNKFISSKFNKLSGLQVEATLVYLRYYPK